MSENVPSIDGLIDNWSDRYEQRFSTAIRRSAIHELIQDFVYHGYNRSDIERSKAKIVKEMVGDSSPHGGIKNWKIKASRDFDKSVRAAFEPIEERTGPVEIPFTPKVMTQEEELEQERSELEELRELNSLEPDIKSDRKIEPEYEVEQEYKYYKPDYDDRKPVIRPELDPLIRENVTASPIMSDEEFFAALERQKNE